MATLRFVVAIPLTPRRIIRETERWLGDIYSADRSQNPERFKREDWKESTIAFLDALISANDFENDDWCHYLAAIWDGDLAYGLRGKDIFQNLNKELLKKNPKYEIMRLADILLAREKNEGVRNKIRMAVRLLKLALWSKEFRKLAVRFLTAIDTQKMEFNIMERYWLANKFDYDYEGKTYEERMAWKAEEDKDFAPEKQKEEKILPRIAINPPNQEFYDLKPDEAQQMIVQTAKVLRDDWLKHQKA